MKGGNPGTGRLRVPLVACVCLLLASAVLAQSNATYDLGWNTVDSGGATFSEGGGYSLGGTAGQPDAGVMSGGNCTLAGGFWPGGAPAAPQSYLYLPLVMRYYP